MMNSNTKGAEYKELSKRTYEKYGIMLLEELYNKMGVDTYHNIFCETGDVEYSYCLKNKDSFVIKPRRYVESRLKIIDENEGKKARYDYNYGELSSINSIKEALSLDFDKYKVNDIIRNIYAMYGVNALASSNCNILDDWELVVDRNKNNYIKFMAKSNKPDFCKLERSYYTGFNQYTYNIDSFIDIVNTDSLALPVAEKLCSIYPEDVIEDTERKRNIKIPEEYAEWFIDNVYANQQTLSNDLMYENSFEKRASR